MRTTVCHVNNPKGYDVYIGRAVPRARLKQSPWANPFRISSSYNRAMVIAQFRDWVIGSDDPRALWIREHVHELRGKRLGCWCYPEDCHGHVLAGFADNGLPM
jgi:hypothetical protein